jgi:hypothetical protein
MGKLAKYSFCGQIIKSSFPFLAKKYFGRKNETVRISKSSFTVSGIKWYHTIKMNNSITYKFGIKNKAYYLKIAKFGTCKISRKQILVDIKTPTTEENISSVIIYGVLPLYFSLKNFLVLHASAVKTKKGAVLFVGEKGMGKSTLAALFSKEGFSVLSDDFILLEKKGTKYYAYPNLSEVRLFKKSIPLIFGNQKLKTWDSYSKKRIDLKQRKYSSAVPLKHIFFLKRKKNKTISITATSNCFNELIQNMYRLDLISTLKIKTEFKMICDLSQNVETSYLDYPRTFDASSSLIKSILVS